MTDRVYDFMKLRHVLAAVSITMIVISLISLAVRGLNFGLDFTGGTQIELQYSETPDLQQVRNTLSEGGFTNPVVVNYGSDREIMVRLQADTAEVVEADADAGANLGQLVLDELQAETSGKITLMRSEVIGSQIGDELANDGGLGMLTALAVVFLYVAIRFQTKFSIGAVAALIHDVIITLGVFSLFQLDFDLTVLAAVLAVVGYSLNDTIVVADRIRENFRTVRDTAPVDLINLSLSQTLGRTLMTSGTTLLVLFALFFVGGALIHNFSLALLVGIGVGTYSSIYVAAAIMLALKLTREDLLPPVKEGEELDELP